MILVTGASGFVGGSIMNFCKDVCASPSLRGLSEDDICRIVEESGADTIIHTAAISDIGECAKDPEQSYIANVLIPTYLAKAAKGRKLICFSSDQVYGGSDFAGPYTEDMAKPANLYAEHKLEMENRVLDIAPNAVLLRAEWMYGYYLKKTNYFMNVIGAKDSLSFSSKQYRGITYVKEVAAVMDKVARMPGGVYNFGCETEKSMYELTRDFLLYIGKDIRIEDAPPRHNLWMSCERARSFGVTFSSVWDGLCACARDFGLVK